MEKEQGIRDLDGTTTPRAVAIAAGGTAGHIYPALAVAEAYRAAVPGLRLLFLGAERGFEQRLFKIERVPLHVLPAAPIARQSLQGRLRALLTLVDGVRHARQVLRAQQMQLVFGFGGYAAAAPIVAARSLGLPSVVHEANALPGLGNRMLGRFVQRAYLGFADAATHFPLRRTVFTGTPVRREFFDAGRHRTAPVGRPLRLLVTGGSQGSAFLNEHAPDLVRQLAKRGLALVVSHQAGEKADEVRQRYVAAGVEASVHSYVDKMAAEFARADFAITCAGAGTLAELAAACLPCLLVPLASAAEDHQSANAAAYARDTGSLWVRENQWDVERLAADVFALLHCPEAMTAAATRCGRAGRPDAATAIVEDCEALLLRRRK